jgi:acyl-CoA synthetase (AMP-forming)/AMP-acid ligase II
VVDACNGDEGTYTLVGCGQALLSQTIAIVDPLSLIRCPPDQIGEIWVSGPSVAEGYWDRAEETKSTFQVYLADTGEGPFLRTGDLGYLSNGELFITGRLKDLIIVRGSNYYPQDIERTVEESHRAVRPGSVAALSADIEGEERLVVVQEVSPRKDLNLDVVDFDVKAHIGVDSQTKVILAATPANVHDSMCLPNSCLFVGMRWVVLFT